MKTKTLVLFTCILFVALDFPLAWGQELELDQAQEGTTYGFWFDNTVKRWQEFKPFSSSLSRLDLYLKKEGAPGDLLVSIKNAASQILWEGKITGADIPALGWIQIAIEPSVPLVPHSSYYIHVAADKASPDAQNRYFWRGQTESTYARGVSSVEASWPRYDFAFRTWSDVSVVGPVCFIYKSDLTGANHYRDLLNANGYPTTLIPIEDVADTDFSSYALILAGSDTGYLYAWGSPDAVETIQASGKRVLGLGFGGACLFQQMGLSINWGHGWIGSKNSIWVVNLSHLVFNQPYDIPVPKDRVIQLYTQTGHIGEYQPHLNPNVILLGREPDDAYHYPLVKEGNHLLWGFTASPANMTLAGKMLFLNVVDHLKVVPPPKLYLSLNVEDALEGVPVNKLVGDTTGPTHYTRLEIVTKLVSYSASAKNDIPVVLNVPGNLLGAPSNVYVRNTNGGDQTAVAYENLGGGRYRVTTDLSSVFVTPWKGLYYRKQIVWRFLIPNELSPQNITVTAQLEVPAVDPIGTGTIRILAPGSPQAIIIANRKLLYDKYTESEVTSLLQRIFTEAQGHPGSHSPPGVVYYVDRYDSRAYNWDNTTISYTSEATANTVPNAIDALIEDWHDDATQYARIDLPIIGTLLIPVAYPKYLLIVGDDDTIPFYRYNDPYNDEGINKVSWCDHGWCVDSNTNPAVHATDLDYYFTDNPYADIGGGTDWQTGDLELWVGRLLGETAADMLSLLREGVDWNNGRRGGVVMASVDGWELGLEADDGRAGEIADRANVPALLRNKGFVVRNDDVPTSEVRTIDVMSPFEGGETSWNTNFRNAANHSGGMDLFFIGGHDSYDHAVIPGDDFSPDDTPTRYTRFGTDHPIAMIVGCHGGLPVPDIDVNGGADHSMVYDLIREGARAYIGATGFSYGSPNNLHKCTWGERLMQEFFIKLLAPPGSNSMALGKALSEAKRDYVFGFGSNDALDRKTVTEFNLYGVPWSFVFYPNAAQGLAEEAAEGEKAKAFETLSGAIGTLGDEPVYTQTFSVKIADYQVQTEAQDSIQYHLFSVQGGDSAVAPGIPILPYVAAYSLPLPHEAKVLEVKVLKAEKVSIGRYNIPIADVQPWSEGGLRYTTKTDINYPYPTGENLVSHQASGEALVFTVFPIQHNPSTDETWFYKTLTVAVTYEAPLTLAISEFALDKTEYMPGESIKATARIQNVGDAEEALSAVLLILDKMGEVVGQVSSRPFTVPSAGSHTLPLAWEGKLPDGAYTAQMNVSSAKDVEIGASQGFSVLSGEIVEVLVPDDLNLGETGRFKVSFANYGSSGIQAICRLSIQDEEGGLVEDLEPREMTVPAGTVRSASFDWTAKGVRGGPHTANATATVKDQIYGPKAESFDLIVDVCEADLDGDKDVDGYDLKVFMSEYGNMNCAGQCAGDLDGNNQVDSKDLAKFAEEYGRANCP
jgi:hypothetical protein